MSLLVTGAPELEGSSGLLFNNKGRVILPLVGRLDRAAREAFLAESQALVARVQVAQPV
ncbi:hypothetical protein [Variovorax guangxiensis]|uniref:hypothetical protein n=1 Tax=Variovorax guangxiensis TaxID=1775474 RepID=UPI002864BC43|nr:hypothetical protein [Variovorax guangxiensis]MDR6858674.1 hypothetical protein [Variovorax guangxiensis]